MTPSLNSKSTYCRKFEYPIIYLAKDKNDFLKGDTIATPLAYIIEIWVIKKILHYQKELHKYVKKEETHD